jgi:hypothetical protein
MSLTTWYRYMLVAPQIISEGEGTGILDKLTSIVLSLSFSITILLQDPCLGTNTSRLLVQSAAPLYAC